MKLRELLFENRIFQNNFIKISMVEEELKRIFTDEKPQIKYDENGMFILMKNSLYRNDRIFSKFSLSDGGIEDEKKNIKKYYIEFTKTPTKSTREIPEESTTEQPSEE